MKIQEFAAFPSENMRLAEDDPMLCKLCRSKNRVRVNAELVLTSTKLNTALQDTALYLIAKPVVCSDCGFVQLKVPKPKLKLLKATLRGSSPNA